MRRALPWVALAALCVLAWLAVARWRDRRDTSADAVDRAVIAANDTTLRRLRADSSRLANQYRVDTLTLRSVETRYRTVRESVPPDLPPVVFRAFTWADSSAAVCRAALVSAEAQTTTCEAKAAALTRQRDAWRSIAQRPGPRVTATLSGLYGVRDGRTSVETEVALRLVGRLSLVAQASQTLARDESPVLQIGASWRF